jgi:hypothetical protein
MPNNPYTDLNLNSVVYTPYIYNTQATNLSLSLIDYSRLDTLRDVINNLDLSFITVIITNFFNYTITEYRFAKESLTVVSISSPLTDLLEAFYLATTNFLQTVLSLLSVFGVNSF